MTLALLTDAELARAGEGGRALRVERRRRRELRLRRKPPGGLAVIERWTWIMGPTTGLPLGRIHRGVELRAFTAAELAAVGPGGKWLRRERRRRAAALLLGALELRWALLQCVPACVSSLWSYGLPLGGGFMRGGRHVEAVRRRAFRRWW